MSTALPSLEKSELMAIEPPAPGLLPGKLDVEQIFAALVADRIALAAAVAELAEVAADRDLRLRAVLGPRRDVEHRLLAGDLLEDALPDVEHDRRTRRARADAHELPEFVLADLRRRAGRRVHRRGVVRREDGDPVAQFLRAARLARFRRHFLGRVEFLLLDELRRSRRGLGRGGQLQQAEVVGPPAADRGGAEQRHDDEHRRQRTPAFSRPPVVPVGRNGRGSRRAGQFGLGFRTGAEIHLGRACRRLRIARRAPPRARLRSRRRAQPRTLPRQALRPWPGPYRARSTALRRGGPARREQPADIRIRCW